MAIDYISIGKRIQSKRKDSGKTQEVLAENLSVTVGYVSQIERGITKVNLETLSHIAEVLNCDVTEFLDGTEKNSAHYRSDDLNEIFGQLNPENKKILVEIADVMLKNQNQQKPSNSAS